MLDCNHRRPRVSAWFPPELSPPQTTIPHIAPAGVYPPGFRDGLFRFRSQLLTESQLISCTALIYMLKFRAFAGGVQREGRKIKPPLSIGPLRGTPVLEQTGRRAPAAGDGRAALCLSLLARAGDREAARHTTNSNQDGTPLNEQLR